MHGYPLSQVNQHTQFGGTRQGDAASLSKQQPRPTPYQFRSAAPAQGWAHTALGCG